MERECVKWQYIVDVCKGMYVFVKASREIFKGTVTNVGQTAIVLDDEVVIRLSSVKWIKIIERGKRDDKPGS